MKCEDPLGKRISDCFSSFSSPNGYTLTDPTFFPYGESTSDSSGYSRALGGWTFTDSSIPSPPSTLNSGRVSVSSIWAERD